MSFNFQDGIFSKKIILISMILLIVFNFIKSHENTEEEINETINKKTITCGSTLRIMNIMTKFK